MHNSFFNASDITRTEEEIRNKPRRNAPERLALTAPRLTMPRQHKIAKNASKRSSFWAFLRERCKKRIKM